MVGFLFIVLFQRIGRMNFRGNIGGGRVGVTGGGRVFSVALFDGQSQHVFKRLGTSVYAGRNELLNDGVPSSPPVSLSDEECLIMDGPQISAPGGDYADPVCQLLTLGKPADFDLAKWPDYAATFGFGHAHIEALIRMACDTALNDDESEADSVWAPVHAWRALGQLRAEAAVALLLASLTALDGDDVADTEIPVVLGMIGPAAIPHIAAFLSDRSNSEWVAATAMSGLAEIGKRHAASRAESIGILTGVLEPHADANPTTNGFAVAALLDLKAVEAIDTIRAAFRRGAIDCSIAGDAEDVEIEFGLRDRRATRAPRHWGLPAVRLPRFETDHNWNDIAALPKRQEVGRNDPCPCGSGKKYKKCCLQSQPV
jgi:hypothetical protein